MADISAEELIKAISNLKGKDLEKVKAKLQVKSDRGDGESDDSYLDRQMKSLEITRQQQKALGEYNNARQTSLAILKELQAVSMKSASEQRENLQAAIDLGDAGLIAEERLKVARAEAHEAYIKQLEEETDGVEELSEAQKESKKYFDETFTGMAEKVGLNSAAMNGLVNSLTKFKEKAKDDPEGLKRSFMDTFSAQKMGLAVMGQVIEASMELALATENATAAFAANTGAGRIMTEQIADVGGQFRNIGLDAEKAGQAAQDLYNNFTGFMTIGKEAQKELMATVASLGKLGIDGATASKTLTLFNKNMGMSLKQSQKLTKQLAMMGKGIGISSSQMVKGFAESAKSLAVYGKDAVKIFSDLAAQAKAANVEASTLLGVAEQFDTFEGAASAAGKLNSILGSQMSATDMLTMSENERIETLIRSVQAQGIAFKDLDKYSQKAIGAAAGINDMAEAQRVFGLSVADYRKGLKVDPKEEEFQQALKDTMTIMEKLKRIGQQFAVSLAPVLDFLAGFTQGILDLNKEMGGYLIPTLGTIIGLLVIIPKIVGVFGPFMAMFATAAPAAGAGAVSLGTGLATAASGILAGAPALFILAGALFVLFAGLALLSAGQGGETGGLQIFGMLSGVALGIIALAAGMLVFASPFALAAMTMASLSLIALALGVGSLGIAVATFDMSKLNGIVAMTDNLKALGDGPSQIGLSIATSFVEDLSSVDAEIKALIGDIALIATGKTTQNLTTNSTAYSFDQFSANFENVFKPQVTVKIGNEEFKEFVIDTQAEGAR
tara:strand:+ start:2135 stop:4480 length:2346 start_codon:yes stop_codon:yes gene_type:complete